MSYKIANFGATHKVSHVKGGVEKFATAVKIGNTNQIGWREHTTPTELNKMHTYLDFNHFHPNARNVCLKSRRLWRIFAWGDSYFNEDEFNVSTNINLHNDHAPLTNRKANRSFGNAKKNKKEDSNGSWLIPKNKNCEIDRKNIPYLGRKYNVSFWMKITDPTRRDTFTFYQNNHNYSFNFNEDVMWRWLMNQSTNILEFIANPVGDSSQVELFVIQSFRDYKSGGLDKNWFGGVKTKVPVNKWVFVNVAIEDSDIRVFFNKKISSSNNFNFEDVVQINSSVTNKAGLQKDSSKTFGRNYNFNDCVDADRTHGLSIFTNSIRICDFRTYKDIAPKNYYDTFLSHLQNHRNQIGDLETGDHTGGYYSPNTEEENEFQYDAPNFNFTTNEAQNYMSNEYNLNEELVNHSQSGFNVDLLGELN